MSAARGACSALRGGRLSSAYRDPRDVRTHHARLRDVTPGKHDVHLTQGMSGRMINRDRGIGKM